MLKKFQFEDCKLVGTPMIVGCKLNKEDDSKDFDQRTYRSMIGILLYVTTSRPDIKQESWDGGQISINTKRDSCLSCKKYLQIFKGDYEPMIMVS